MLNIFSPLKKILGKNQEVPQESDKSSSKVTDHLSLVSNFLDSKIGGVVEHFQTIREKSKNLPKTNYDLGMKHLESGHLSEAIFRFKITKKFWPDYYDAYYQLAYALILSGEFEEAEKVINELLEKNPDYHTKVEELFKITEKELSRNLSDEDDISHSDTTSSHQVKDQNPSDINNNPNNNG